MASIVDRFPRRPLALRPDPRRKRKRLVLILVALLVALPALYWGYQSVSSARLRADLRARGVEAAETMDANGDCTSRQSRLSGSTQPIDCWFDVNFRLRSEEGGAVRTGHLHLEGESPLFTPPVVYDPQDPGRAMLRPEMEREMTWSELLGPLFLLLLPLAALIPVFINARRGLARAAARPDPVILPIAKAVRRMPANRLEVHFGEADGSRAYVDIFTGETPLIVPTPAGAPRDQQWALALRDPSGRPHLLDMSLAWFDFTPDERDGLQRAARGS